MKIWYLTSEFPPDFGGGISMYIQQVASMMSQNGNDVTVIVRDPHDDAIEIQSKNLRIVRFRHMVGDYYKHLGYWVALSFQYCEEVLDLIDKDGAAPDVIEVQEYNAIGYYLLQKKYMNDPRLINTKILIHLHTPTFELTRINQQEKYAFPNYWIGQMEKFCINAADGLVTQSQFLKKQISSYVKNKEINVIPLPYQVEENYIQNSNKEFDLLYLGRTEYRKGIVHLLNEMNNLWEEGNDIKVKILGGDTFFSPRNGMLGQWLKKKYSKWIDSGLLVFQNTVHPSELPSELGKAKLAIIPSIYENYPYNCIISMYNKVPVIVSKSGGQSEMVFEDEKNGFIFDWDIEGSFSEKLLFALSLPDKKLNEVGINGYNRIKQLCSIASNYEARINLYNELTKLENNKLYPISLSIAEKTPYHTEVEYEKGLLSIIVPYYNLGDYVGETIDSALNTDYQNFEIVIINDGSTDSKSIEVLNNISNLDNRIRVVTIKNGGLANARNVGAHYAKGEFIAFLDADDLIDRTFYSKSISLLNSYDNISFVYSWVKFFGARDGVWPTFNTEFPYFLGMNMLTAFVVVRKKDFVNFGMNKKVMEYGLEDYEGWLGMCENGYSGVSIPEVLVNYRVRHESMSRQFNRAMVVYLLNRMSEHHPNLYSKFGLEIYNLIVANGPGYLWNNPTFDHPNVEYSTSNSDQIDVINDNSIKYELMRIAESKLGKKLIRLAFKLKVNKLF